MSDTTDMDGATLFLLLCVMAASAIFALLMVAMVFKLAQCSITILEQLWAVTDFLPPVSGHDVTTGCGNLGMTVTLMFEQVYLQSVCCRFQMVA